MNNGVAYRNINVLFMQTDVLLNSIAFKTLSCYRFFFLISNLKHEGFFGHELLDLEAVLPFWLPAYDALVQHQRFLQESEFDVQITAVNQK